MLKALQVQKTGDNKWIEVEEENRKHFEWDGLMMVWLLDLPIYLSFAVHKPSTSTDDVADEFRKRCRCHYVVGVNGFAKSSFGFTTTSPKVEVCFWPQFIDSVG